MTASSTGTYVGQGVVLALAVGGAAGGGALLWAPAQSGWLLGAYGATVLVGLGSGTWVVSRLGKTGPRFLLALASGAVARLLLVGLAVLPLALRGPAAFWAWIAGVACGFVPFQVHEIRHVARAARGTSSGAAAMPPAR